MIGSVMVHMRKNQQDEMLLAEIIGIKRTVILVEDEKEVGHQGMFLHTERNMVLPAITEKMLMRDLISQITQKTDDPVCIDMMKEKNIVKIRAGQTMTAENTDHTAEQNVIIAGKEEKIDYIMKEENVHEVQGENTHPSENMSVNERKEMVNIIEKLDSMYQESLITEEIMKSHQKMNNIMKEDILRITMKDEQGLIIVDVQKDLATLK